jgi:hypothetical protein
MLNPQGLHPEAGPQITEMRVRSSENRNVFGFRFPGFAILPEFEADLVALPERSSALERGEVLRSRQSKSMENSRFTMEFSFVYTARH